MEIERIRKEINELLESVLEHSSRYSDERPIPSLEISFVLNKVNNLQENLSILKHLLKEKERASKQSKIVASSPLIEEDLTKEVQELEKPIEVSETKPSTLQPKVSLSENLEHSPIKKLIDALTLNDRYLYANELFNKDMNSFNELVKAIDNSSSLDEVQELISPLNWDGENKHVLSFQILIERRFS